MAYYSPDIVKEVKKIDLLTYLKICEPNELVRFSNDTYVTKTHDSLKISNGYWNWFSHGCGGKTALEYLIKVKNYDFLQAVNYLHQNFKANIPIQHNKFEKAEEKRIILPSKNSNCNRIKSYLIYRGIDKEIIEECIRKNLIYEDQSHNLICLGYDSQGNIRYASCRSTTQNRFMKEANGSCKRYSFRLESQIKVKEVHIFEAAIDLLSYATLLKLKGLSWKDKTLISLAGVYQPAKEISNSKVPMAIEEYLSKNPQICTIYLHLDNDPAGRNASLTLQKILPTKYKIYDIPPPKCKDVNDYLCYQLGRKIELKKGRNIENARI